VFTPDGTGESEFSVGRDINLKVMAAEILGRAVGELGIVFNKEYAHA